MSESLDGQLKNRTAIAAALESVAIPAERWQLPAMARGLLRGYDARWRDAHRNIEILEIEKTYKAPLINPASSRLSRTFSLAGKLDKIVRENGLVFYDHKTTSYDISDPNGDYWRQLQIDGQAKFYEILLRSNGIAVERIVWDVIRKPRIKPKKLAKAAQAEIVSLGTYCGFKVSQDTIERTKYATEENAELYEHRVARESLDNPDRYFQRQPVMRLDDELVEHWSEVWDISGEIREARRNGRWSRNSGACMNYGRACQFLAICSGHDAPDSDEWATKKNVHSELDDIDGDGRSVITNSRLRCFQTCHRKHFYQYELGIEKPERETEESLYFGSLFHASLDKWWAAASL